MLSWISFLKFKEEQTDLAQRHLAADKKINFMDTNGSP